MLGGLAEVLSIDPELLDDLKTSISEACNNVVLHAYGGEPGPMRIRLWAGTDRLRVTVDDEGVGMPQPDPRPEEPHGIGVSVIRALTQDARFSPGRDGGTEVQMDFSARRDGRALFVAPGEAAPDEPDPSVAPGEVVVTLSPVSLLAPVLGRLARTLAATAHFSLDRFSDVYLVTDTIAAHAASAASAPRVDARLMAGERRLELVIGPFRRGSGAQLEAAGAGHASPLALLSDQVSVQLNGDHEMLHVVVIDHREP